MSRLIAADRLLLAIFVLFLVGCAAPPLNPFETSVLREPRQSTEDQSYRTPSESDEEAAPSTRFLDTPKVAALKTVAGSEQPLPRSLQGEPVTVNVNNLPLPVFINKVYGDLLGLSFSIAPALREKRDLVTLRLTEPQSLSELFRIARTVLADYGVAVIEEEALLRFVSSQTAAGDEVPLMVSGRTLPEVPPSHRPIFQLVQLKAVRNTSVIGWLREALGANPQLKILEDAFRNAIWLKGPRAQVRQALELIELLDQPLLKGRHSMAIEPVFLSPDELAGALERILKSEGYEVAQIPPYGAILLVPIDVSGTLIVFASESEVLGHVKAWAQRLDRHYQDKIEEGIFFYHVRNTQAESLLDVLDRLNLAESMQERTSTNPPDGGNIGARAESGRVRTPRSTNKLVADKNINALIFRGDGKSWSRIITVLKELDKPAPQVLVEVLVAEVTVTQDQRTGFSWLIDGVNADHLDGQLQFGDFSLVSGGLSLVLNSAGSTRAILNMLFRNDRAVIRSSPRVIVKSGEEASIEVGTEIPIITSQTSAADIPGPSVNQNIQYRKTGVLLRVRPVVQGNGVVELEISQELSQESESGSSGIDSPSIFTRSVHTTLSLNDGGSVLLGGMISTTTTNNVTRVPLLSSIPWLGRLFRSDVKQEITTELLIMVIPYILNDGNESVSITEAFRKKLGDI